MAYNKETGMYEGYIYKIYNDVNDKIYIGQTIRTVNIRWHEHMNAAYTEELYNNILYKAMRKHGVINFHIKEICKISYFQKTELTHKLDILEKQYIKQCDCVIPNGYNMTKGGEHVSVNKETSVDAYYANGDLYKSYNSMAEAYEDVKYDQNANNGMSVICKCCKGELESGYGFIWRYHGDRFDKYSISRTQEEIERVYGVREVCKYSLCGEYISSYKSLTEVRKELGITSVTQISNCCNGKARTAYGFVWRYNGDAFDKYKNENSNQVQIDQYSLDGKLISSYESITDAIKNVRNSSQSSISLCCNGKLRQHKGYVWRYHNDSFYKYSLINGNSKKVNQYTIDGKYINTFDSITIASNDNGAPNASTISRCCNHISKPRKGFLWFYANDPTQPDKTKIIN